ncbi:MAG TPA: ferrous iron transport protein B [Sphaerochaeta sp.]|nr:ferrous iron transport protein B [Sphaerochaeta sp.]HQB90761.1 ferrous iron transport protein B [Sphaerochaeta sp.]
MKTKRIALVGNPNSGKTTLFNAITGSNQHVGNWPGVTVEKKEGTFTYKGKEYDVVDLPGIYSLGAFSEDEVVAMDYILTDDADVIIDVIDASNIERNLYLTTQLLEMGKNVVIALNMVDEAEKRQIAFDLEAMSSALGVPVVATVASRNNGTDAIIQEAVKAIDKKVSYTNPLTYSENVNHHMQHMVELFAGKNMPYSPEWAAIKVVEGDKHIISVIEASIDDEAVVNGIKDFHKFHSSENFELEIVDSRYAFAHRIAEKTVKRPEVEVVTLTDKIDKILINKYLGIPIFALIMLAVFQLTFAIGQDLLGGYAAALVEWLGTLLENFLVWVNSPDWLVSFMIDGVVNGVGAVVEFVPLITVMYLLLSLLEDSGYMARAAYVWDNLMRAFGMQGKAFISMIIGFGCTVPAIMSTRTMDNKKDRMVTMLITPFMSCGAKLPIYSVFIAAFFSNHGGLVLFGLYAFGILIGLLMAKLFNKTLFKGESSYFIMELPPYRFPAAKSVLRTMWLHVGDFIKRAGTIIFLVVTIMWLLAVLPGSAAPYSQQSYLGRLGTFLVPIFRPAGFGTWQESVALFAGIPAKEAVVGTLGMLYAGEYMEEGVLLVNAIQQHFTSLTALAYMVMVLLYTPCAATLSAVAKETKSAKWTIAMALYTFFIGWIMAVLVFQIGSLFGFA